MKWWYNINSKKNWSKHTFGPLTITVTLCQTAFSDSKNSYGRTPYRGPAGSRSSDIPSPEPLFGSMPGTGEGASPCEGHVFFTWMLGHQSIPATIVALVQWDLDMKFEKGWEYPKWFSMISGCWQLVFVTHPNPGAQGNCSRKWAHGIISGTEHPMEISQGATPFRWRLQIHQGLRVLFVRLGASLRLTERRWGRSWSDQSPEIWKMIHKDFTKDGCFCVGIWRIGCIYIHNSYTIWKQEII